MKSELNSVVVTGLGPVSAVGCGREVFWNALTQGQSGFGPLTLCDASESPSQVAAEVRGFELKDYLPRGRALARMNPRPAQFALASAALALDDAGLNGDNFDHATTGLAMGTGLANIDLVLKTWTTYNESGLLLPIASYQVFHHNIACVLTSVFDLRGSCHTLSSGCNSGLDALGFALRQIQVGATDVMLCVGTDCEVVPAVIGALNASGSLSSRYNEEPHRASRPFDKDRDGNVIGEGACCLVLESERHAKERGARIYADFSGYSVCSAGKGRRYSHDNPETDLGPSVRAMRHALSQAGLGHPDVVSANGSSSVRYDIVESQALQALLGEHYSKTPVHSVKSMLGQHGAGTSALQAAAACLSLSSGNVPGTINCENLDERCGELNVLTKTEELKPKSVLTLAIGLGGFYYSAGVFTAHNQD